MKLKSYVAARGAVAMILGMVVAVSIVKDNFVVPIIALAVGALVLLLMRRRVTEVVYDERDWALAGKSAAYAIQIYSISAVVLMLIFYAYRGRNPAYEPIALTLAYSTAGLMFLYASLFKYYNRIKMSRNRIILGALIAFAAAVLALVSVRFLSGEDDWICSGGKWVEHGHPSFPAPAEPCRE